MSAWLKLLLWVLVFSPASLFAQNAVTVINSAPDESSGSWGWAVTTLNGSGSAGAITFASTTHPILNLTLPGVSQGVTLEGGFLWLVGQDDSQAQLLFQQALTQLNSLELDNNGGLGTGLDVSVTASSWTMAVTSTTNLYGLSGASTVATSGVGVTGQNGGNASVTVGVWTVGQSAALNAGSGGSVTDTGGSGDLGGNGGSAFVTAGSLLLPGSLFQLTAGAGGIVTDLGSGTNQGGNGGFVSLQSGFISIGDFANFTLTGGAGGQGVTGGSGGAVTLAAGAVSVVSSLNLQAGNGGNGILLGGFGGDAYLSFTNLTQSATNRYLYVTGGNGGNSSSIGGNGGNAVVFGGTVSLTGNSGFQVTGGSGGSFASGIGGNGGNASVSISGFLDTSNAYVTITGGNGGSGSSGATPGAGGQGGNSSLYLGSFSISGANVIVLGGGLGGAAGDNSGSGLGGSGGAGGSLSVSFGTLSSTAGSGLTLTGNSGGEGGASSGGTGGAGGNGGSVYFWAGGVTLAAGDNLDLIGGAGGAGGSGIANGSNGIQGTISAAVTQNLLNQGNLILDATNAILQVGGAYTQTSGASLQLVLGGSGAVSSGFVTVGGTAQLGGGLDLTAASGLTAPAIGQSVTLMAAGSLTGQFDNVNESLTGMRLLPLYFSQALLLESINPSFQSSGVTPNQKAIGVDLDAVALKPQLNGLMASIGVLSNSSMQAIFGQLTPEDFTALYQAGFEGALSRAALVDQRLSELMNDVDNTPWLPGFSSTGTPWFAANLPASQEAAMAPSKSSPWGGFISGNGGIFNVASDANAAGYKVTTYGLTGAGADYRLSRELAVGLLVGYGHTNVVLGTGGTLSADGGQIGLYGLLYSEGFYATGLVEGGINSYGTQRQGYNGVATGSTQGSQFDGALELGYQWKAAQVKIGPMASAQYSSVGMNGFTEQGSQGALTFPTQTENSLLSRLGIRANSQWSLGKGSALSPSLQLAWEHEFNYQGGNIQAGFGTGDSFTVAGPQIGQDGLLAGAGVEISWAKSWTLSLQYQGEFGRTNLTSSQIGGGVKFGF